MAKRQRGRPMTSNKVQVTPEFRDNPDVEKLARALISIAIHIAEQKKSEEASDNQPKTTTHIKTFTEQGDDMT